MKKVDRIETVLAHAQIPDNRFLTTASWGRGMMRARKDMTKTLVLTGKIVGALAIFLVTLGISMNLAGGAIVGIWLTSEARFQGLAPEGPGLPRQYWMLFFTTTVYLLPLPIANVLRWRKSLRWITVPLFASGVLSAFIFFGLLAAPFLEE